MQDWELEEAQWEAEEAALLARASALAGPSQPHARHRQAAGALEPVPVEEDETLAEAVQAVARGAPIPRDRSLHPALRYASRRDAPAASSSSEEEDDWLAREADGVWGLPPPADLDQGGWGGGGWESESEDSEDERPGAAGPAQPPARAAAPAPPPAPAFAPSPHFRSRSPPRPHAEAFRAPARPVRGRGGRAAPAARARAPPASAPLPAWAYAAAAPPPAPYGAGTGATPSLEELDAALAANQAYQEALKSALESVSWRRRANRERQEALPTFQLSRSVRPAAGGAGLSHPDAFALVPVPPSLAKPIRRAGGTRFNLTGSEHAAGGFSRCFFARPPSAAAVASGAPLAPAAPAESQLPGWLLCQKRFPFSGNYPRVSWKVPERRALREGVAWHLRHARLATAFPPARGGGGGGLSFEAAREAAAKASMQVVPSLADDGSVIPLPASASSAASAKPAPLDVSCVDWEAVRELHCPTRTALECEGRWRNFEEPLLNLSTKWTALEDSDLQSVISALAASAAAAPAAAAAPSAGAAAAGEAASPAGGEAQPVRAGGTYPLHVRWEEAAAGLLERGIVAKRPLPLRSPAECLRRFRTTLQARRAPAATAAAGAPAKGVGGRSTWTKEDDEHLKSLLAIDLLRARPFRSPPVTSTALALPSLSLPAADPSAAVAAAVRPPPGRMADIARLLGKSAASLYHRVAQSQVVGKVTGKWRAEEDAQLRASVGLHAAGIAPGEPFPWKLIAEGVEGRTDVQCRQRWVHVLSPDITKREWDTAEMATLRAAVEANAALVGEGRRLCWTAIAAGVAGRTESQCRIQWKHMKAGKGLGKKGVKRRKRSEGGAGAHKKKRPAAAAEAAKESILSDGSSSSDSSESSESESEDEAVEEEAGAAPSPPLALPWRLRRRGPEPEAAEEGAPVEKAAAAQPPPRSEAQQGRRKRGVEEAAAPVVEVAAPAAQGLGLRRGRSAVGAAGPPPQRRRR